MTRHVLAAARAQRGLVVLLLALAAGAWWWTIARMQGMDAGPWTRLGSAAWFVGVWAVMTAAMMLPSALPAIVVYGSMARDRRRLLPFLFTVGYLLAWSAAGLGTYAAVAVGQHVAGGVLAWGRGGRWATGATLLLAAVYQLTPLKDTCLRRCRAPHAFLLSSWRPGAVGALRLGVTHGTWCLGCCWALMASLFALGIMSTTWMALVAALVAVEKTLPWRRTATWAAAALLLALGAAVLATPTLLPIPTALHGRTAG